MSDNQYFEIFGPSLSVWLFQVLGRSWKYCFSRENQALDGGIKATLSDPPETSCFTRLASLLSVPCRPDFCFPATRIPVESLTFAIQETGAKDRGSTWIDKNALLE